MNTLSISRHLSYCSHFQLEKTQCALIAKAAAIGLGAIALMVGTCILSGVPIIDNLGIIAAGGFFVSSTSLLLLRKLALHSIKGATHLKFQRNDQNLSEIQDNRNKQSQEKNINILPLELFFHIFSFLRECNDFANLIKVDKNSNNLVLEYLAHGQSPPLLSLKHFNFEKISSFPRDFNSIKSIESDGKSLDLIIKSKNLEELYISTDFPSGNKITDEQLAIISNSCLKIKNLALDTCINLTDQGLKKALTNLPLEHLSLVRCEKINYAESFNLSTDLIRLQSLRLYNNTPFKDQTNRLNLSIFDLITKKCPKLEELYLTEFSIVGNSEYLTILRDNCPNLKKISIGIGFEFNEDEKYDEKDFINLVEACPNLIKLEIRSPLILTDNFFKALAKKCKYLKIIEITGKISDEGLNALISNCKNLEILSLAGIQTMNGELYCDPNEWGKITVKGIECLTSNGTRLSKVELNTSVDIPRKTFDLLSNLRHLKYASILTPNIKVCRTDNYLRIKELE